MGPTPKPRAFFDADVLLSALSSPDSPASRALELFLAGTIQAVVSRQVLVEVCGAVVRCAPHLAVTLAGLLMPAPPEVHPDADADQVLECAAMVGAYDGPILAAAVAASVQWLITGHSWDLAPAVMWASERGLRIVTPQRFLQLAGYAEDAEAG